MFGQQNGNGPELETYLQVPGFWTPRTSYLITDCELPSLIKQLHLARGLLIGLPM